MEPEELLRQQRAPSRCAVVRERSAEWIAWVGWQRLLGSVVIMAAAAVGGWWLLRSSPPPVERSLPYPAASSTTIGTGAPAVSFMGAEATPSAVVVHVAGAVARPGLVQVAGDARVADAIRAAGGALAGADPDALNLAARVVDGARIYVPRLGEVVSTSEVAGGQSGSALPLDINAADTDALDSLPGIGPSLARAIVAYREAHGPFRGVDSLLDVPGIGPAKLEQFRSLVRA